MPALPLAATAGAGRWHFASRVPPGATIPSNSGTTLSPTTGTNMVATVAPHRCNRTAIAPAAPSNSLPTGACAAARSHEQQQVAASAAAAVPAAGAGAALSAPAGPAAASAAAIPAARPAVVLAAAAAVLADVPVATCQTRLLPTLPLATWQLARTAWPAHGDQNPYTKAIVAAYAQQAACRFSSL